MALPQETYEQKRTLAERTTHGQQEVIEKILTGLGGANAGRGSGGVAAWFPRWRMEEADARD